MADSPGTTNSVSASAVAVRDNIGVSFPWALIGACSLVIVAIAGCLIYIYVHLLDQDKILLRIDQDLCTVAIHDATVDRSLARKSGAKVVIEVPIDCKELSHD